ncbi:hypothetical protein L083_0650 [Actinoplanes sp. N902-109]|nr:hypothetical protein L083_0650 [Actinoplanes sp. N902-109]
MRRLMAAAVLGRGRWGRWAGCVRQPPTLLIAAPHTAASAARNSPPE